MNFTHYTFGNADSIRVAFQFILIIILKIKNIINNVYFNLKCKNIESYRLYLT